MGTARRMAVISDMRAKRRTTMGKPIVSKNPTPKLDARTGVLLVSILMRFVGRANSTDG